jgi:5,10-methylenetetrahydromethanopterin reductase
MDVWLHTFSFPRRVSEIARRAEDWGFSGLLLADSQNLTADIWVELALAAATTSRLRLGPGVTNLTTRHPAVTASAAATLQAETGGRAVLGLGRGDSALTQIGRSPLTLAEFEERLAMLQTYLRGEEARIESTSSTIRWLATAPMAKVPVEVTATGPKMIALAARHAEGIDFAVGAELDRLRWAIGIARTEAPERRSLGAFVNVAVHPITQVAHELVRGSVAIFARFSSQGSTLEGLSDLTRAGITRLASGYEAERHGQSAGSYAERLDDPFIERFAVAGPPAEVRDRLMEIAALGIDRLIVVPGSLDSPPDLVQESLEHFADEVLAELAC